MADKPPLSTAELEAGLDAIRQSPRDQGVLQMIVRRPKPLTREVLNAGELNLVDGLAGNNKLPFAMKEPADRT